MLLLKKKLICFILFLAQMNEEAPRVLAKEINTSKLANKTIELNKISYESVGNSQAKIDENFNSEKSFPYNEANKEENQKNTETAEVSKPVQIAFMTNGKPFYTFF
ncbi:uncharacterized protein LOC126902356 isoform X3 [Daktulosphaira vitifoliae]|uniref:uncharacterized protein LOC126902356 isoform X3 n=1 Tax=Daktulosphaira vitifoliae TaxID=58002 RepID=UPI0021AAD64A|nr:uncharacterized protein LOC126902356 isoform X3 [Daktulosphaira vitifoliae]